MAARRRTAPQEPPPPSVLVEWTRTTSDAASEHSCSIGDRRYRGRLGERVEIRSDDAEILAAGGYVNVVVAEQVG
jgi:hypothetical protein